MRIFICLLVGLIFISHSLFSQITFEKTYGTENSDYGYYVEQTLDGGYILCGYSLSWQYNGENDSVFVYNPTLIKTDVLGNVEWSNDFVFFENALGYCVHETTDGDFLLTGYKREIESGYSDVFCAKTNSNGDTIWTGIYDIKNYDRALSIQQTNDGGYIITGYSFEDVNDNNSNILLMKISNMGDVIWINEIGGSGCDKARCVQQATDGGYILVGTTTSFGNGGFDVYLVKTDNLGDTVFTKTFGGYSGDGGYCVLQNDDGGFIIAGETWSFNPIDNRRNDAYIIKTDAIGDTIWTKRIGWDSFESCKSIDHTKDNGYIITGYTESFGNFYGDLYLIKMNNVGDTLWSKVFSGDGGSFGTSVQQTEDGGYIVGGYTSCFGEGQYDYYLIKTDQNGIVNVQIPELQTNLQVTLYPNPSNNNLKIRSQCSIKTLEIFNTNGEVVFNRKNIDKEFIDIDIRNLHAGVYLIKITTVKGKVIKKLIVHE